jgi:diamine N-acetyltransferase
MQPNETLPPDRTAQVSLREITRENLRAIFKLKVSPEQEKFVAPTAASIAEAYFDRDHAWFRAIYADETPVGFLMLFDDPAQPLYYLWRFLVDARYQGLGFGYRGLALLIEHVRQRPDASKLLLSYVPEAGNPSPFYAKLGFVETGVEHEGELEMELNFNDAKQADPGQPAA